MKYSHKKKLWLLKWKGTLSVAKAFLLLPSKGKKKIWWWHLGFIAQLCWRQSCFSRSRQETEQEWVANLQDLSPLDSATEIPQGFPSLQFFLIIHNLVAFGFIKAILTCVC